MIKKTLLQKIFGTAEERREHSLKNVIKSTFAGVTTAGVADCVVQGLLNTEANRSLTELIEEERVRSMNEFPCSANMPENPAEMFFSENPAVQSFAFDLYNGDAI